MCKYCERENAIALKGGINVNNLKVIFLFSPSNKELMTKVESSELCVVKANDSQKVIGKIETKTEIKYCPFCGKKLGVKLLEDIINENKVENGLLDILKDNEKNIFFVYKNNSFPYGTLLKFNNIYYYISISDKTLQPISYLQKYTNISNNMELIESFDFNKETKICISVGNLNSFSTDWINIEAILCDKKLHIECENTFIKIISNLELI